LNPQTIRKLDRHLGKPVCGLLTALRRISHLFRSPPNFDSPPKKILLIKMIEQGATVLAYRAIARAVEMVGRENVYFWVFDDNQAILELLDLLPRENILSVRSSGLIPFSSDVIHTLRQIRRLKIDATVDMEFFARAPAIFAFLTGALRRVGLHSFNSEGPYVGDLLTHRVQYNPYIHTAASYLMLVDALLADPAEQPLPKRPVPQVDFAPPAFRPSAGETDAVQKILDTLAGRSVSRPIVLLNPNASDLLPLRRWPVDRFISLGKGLLEQYPQITLGITGAPAEAPAAEGIARAIGSTDRVLNLAGKTTLRQLLVLYTMSDVLVTNDSGPGHFSSMTEIHSIVLFGPETPLLFAPLGRNSHVLSANLACSPCATVMNHRFSSCNNNVCMQEIKLQQVFAEIQKYLPQLVAAR
jgi:ADP-heptose:LPS heptosyltransferase